MTCDGWACCSCTSLRNVSSKTSWNRHHLWASDTWSREKKLSGPGAGCVEEIKSGLKVSLYYMYLLKRLAKVVKSTHLVSDNDDDAAEVDKFVDVLDLNNNYLFRDVVYKMWQNRETRLRKPELLWSYTVRLCCRTCTSSGRLMRYSNVSYIFSWQQPTWMALYSLIVLMYRSLTHSLTLLYTYTFAKHYLLSCRYIIQ